jgi:hypothetical protein
MGAVTRSAPIRPYEAESEFSPLALVIGKAQLTALLTGN